MPRNAKQVSGSSDDQFVKVVIDYPFGTTPTINVTEQRKTVLSDGSRIITSIGDYSFIFDPAYEFDVLNPNNDSPTGKKQTGDKVYQMIYSYVVAKKNEILAQQAQQTPIQ